MSTPHKSFFFDGHVVGGFEDFPTEAGVCTYMPSRGIGHLRVIEERKKGRAPRCSFKVGGCRVSFAVQEIVGLQKLRIDGFQKAKEKEPIRDRQLGPAVLAVDLKRLGKKTA